MAQHLREFTKYILELPTPVPCTNQPDLFDLDAYWKPSDMPLRQLAITTAKEMCSRCPVKDMCLDTALSERITEMIWGGLTPHERDALLVARNERQKRRDAIS